MPGALLLRVLPSPHPRHAHATLHLSSPFLSSPFPSSPSSLFLSTRIASLFPLLQAYRLQVNGFLREVRAGCSLPMLKQHLLLYSSIPLAKLAGMLEMEEGALRTSLLCLTSKGRRLVLCMGGWGECWGAGACSVLHARAARWEEGVWGSRTGTNAVQEQTQKEGE